MGLLKSTKSVKARGGSTQVAQDITSAYLYIRDTYPQIGNTATYLGAAGLNNAAAYLKKNQIRPIHIIRLAKTSIQAGRDGVADELGSIAAFAKALAVAYTQIEYDALGTSTLQPCAARPLAVYQAVQSTLRNYNATHKTRLIMRKGIDMFFSLSSMRSLVSQLMEETQDDWGHIAK